MSIPETPYTRLEMYLDEIARNGGGGGGGGSSSLSGLTDVDISNPTDGQTLVYNATSGKWENGAGGLEFVEMHVDPETDITDMTWQQAYDAIASGKLIIFKDVINRPEDFAVYAFTTIYTAVEKIFGGDGEPDEYHLSGIVVDYHGIPGASVLTASSPNDYLLM